MSSPASPGGLAQSLGSLGLGYAIAIALGLLVLISTLLLVSYVCCRGGSSRPRGGAGDLGSLSFSNNPSAAAAAAGLPHIIFVAEDDDDGDGDGADRSPAPGLDQAAINSYPKFAFCKGSAKLGGGDVVCAVCLCEYREGEMLRMMPDCRHAFHLPCIDAWLRLNASCPVCRTSPMPTPQSTPLSTPLSELVPLSQFSADRRRR
ncbi:RING-H2 finger protein ATL67-like [Wolffia australiana]